jgi:hypothetical protein
MFVRWRKASFCRESYIRILNIYLPILLSIPKKQIFPLNVRSFEWLDAIVIEIGWPDISVTLVSLFEMLLQQQVICSCYMIVLVCLNASFSVLDIKVELFQRFENVLVDRNSMVAHDDATTQRNIVYLLAPFMIIDLFNFIAFAWIYSQYLFKKILELAAHEIGEYIFAW